MEQRINGSTIRLIVFILILGVLSLFAGLYAEWLWFDSVNFASVFTTIVLNKIALYVTLFTFGFLLFYINLRITRKNMGLSERPEEDNEGREVIYLDQERPSPWRDFMQGPYTKWIFVGVSLFGGFILSSVAGDYWIVIQQYLNRVAVGTVDPIFAKDLGFYFFNLNFYQFIYSTLIPYASHHLNATGPGPPRPVLNLPVFLIILSPLHNQYHPPAWPCLPPRAWRNGLLKRH
jgi:uncharacterized membrane protein (UPF0182 family)